MYNSTLYLVPTPIGNLDDITIRALEVLKKSDLIICEDTRHTLKLLTHFGIKKKLLSFFTYNQARRIPKIISELRSGKIISLVSDSGTPGISDPGFYLIRQVIEEGIRVVPLPGPSAFTTALIASGLPTDGFVFLGFLKKKPGKMKKEIERALLLQKTIIFYESPHRIKKTVSTLSEILHKNIKMVLAREITKIFEEFIRGTIEEVAEILKKREIKGEIVVIISPLEKAQK